MFYTDRHSRKGRELALHPHAALLFHWTELEREVRIVADRGISKKISQDLWNIIAEGLASDIKAGNAKEGFISAVQKCGDLLAQN